ncbi:MAG: HAD family hydrolase [Anaeroplasmataceae bacterium]|nr:HAD family hydrolase [Anaeroplasmataceae bacterium]
MEIYLDLDNTLLNDDKMLSNEGFKCLTELSVKHKICILTTAALNEVSMLFSIPNLYIVSTIENKCFVNGKYLYEKLETSILDSLLDSPYIYTLYGVDLNTTYVIKYQERMKLFYPNRRIEICSHFPKSIASFILAVYKTGVDEILKRLNGYHVETLASDSKKTLLLVSSKPSTKEAWLLKLKKSPAIAIGDSLSDYAFIKHCEIQVAMQNADEELKALCAYKTSKTNQEDGALDFILNYLKHQQA